MFAKGELPTDQILWSNGEVNKYYTVHLMNGPHLSQTKVVHPCGFIIIILVYVSIEIFPLTSIKNVHLSSDPLSGV